MCVMAHHDRADGFAGVTRCGFLHANGRAEASQDGEHASARRIEPDVLDGDLGPWQRRRGDHPERSRRKISGYNEFARVKTLTADDGHAPTGRHHVRAKRLQRALRVVSSRK